MTCVSVLELFILFPLLVRTCSSQNDTQEEERTVPLQGMVDKSIAEKHFKAIGEYLKQKNMYADDLESLKQYTSLLETELLTLKNTTKQMSVKVEQLMGSLRAEQEIVKNQTHQIDEYTNKIKNYLEDLNDCMRENKLLTEKLKNQTDEIRCKNSEDIRSSIVLIELMFNDLFKVKESRTKQWTRFYQTMQGIVHQKNTTTNDISEKLKPLLKSTPEKILKDLETYFNSAEQFGETVDECFKRLSDDIQAYHQSKPLSDDNITMIMHKALQIIIDAFLSDAQKSTSKLKTIT